MLKLRNTTLYATVIGLAALALAAAPVHAADANTSSHQRQQKLIDVLKSDAPPAEKAITCKYLAIYGNSDAVPALAALLPDKDLSSWARIALEAIPGPAADAALRDAMDHVQGRLLVGVINSIAYRRDAKAVDRLLQKLKDSDPEVAAAAAVALGRIGGNIPAQALEQSLATTTGPVRSAVAEGCILCAEHFLANGDRDRAVKLYDTVRRTDLPKQRILEAIRGAILARGSDGIPLLVEHLRSPDRNIVGIALRAARELPSPQVTDALVAELTSATPDRQSLLLFALADRGDVRALPAVLNAARTGPIPVRIVAAGVLERLGGVSCVPVLLEAATSNEAELAKAAKTTLARLPGKDVDADLFARLQQSAGKMRQVLIELTEERRIAGALPVFVQCAQDPDAGVRAAALTAIGAIGEDEHVADLTTLLQKTQEPAARSAIERAITAICGRWATACIPHLQPLVSSGNSANRIVGLRALACCGGPDALAALTRALDDNDPAVQDEAVRMLSAWPNRWPDDGAVTEPLLNLAKSGKKPQHKVLALRGYLQYVQGARGVQADQRLAKVNTVLPLITRPEEKRLAISVLSSIGTAGVLEPLITFAADPATAEEACSAIINLARRSDRGISTEQRQRALQTVLEKSRSDALRRRAEEMLNK